MLTWRWCRSKQLKGCTTESEGRSPGEDSSNFGSRDMGTGIGQRLPFGEQAPDEDSSNLVVRWKCSGGSLVIDWTAETRTEMQRPATAKGGNVRQELSALQEVHNRGASTGLPSEEATCQSSLDLYPLNCACNDQGSAESSTQQTVFPAAVSQS